MSAVGSVVSHLLGDTKVRGRVGQKVYRAVAARKAELPYIVVQKIGARRVRHMAAVAGLVAMSLQVACWADAVSGSDELADFVRRSLDHRNHEDIGSQPNVVALKAAFLESEIEDVVPAAVGGGSIFGTIMTWTIWHTETVPTF